MTLAAGASVITDDLNQYPHVPQWYRLSNLVTPTEEQNVHDLIRITPVYYAIISNPSDAALAYRFATVVLTAADEASASALAQQIFYTAEGHPNRSIIITSETNILTAVYADREAAINVGST
jgi:hypothetical protein